MSVLKEVVMGYEESYLVALMQVIEGFADSYAFWAYCILGVSAFVENIVPPIPGDTVVAFGALLVGRESLHAWPVLFVTSLGSFVGFMTLYYLGLVLGKYWEKSDRQRFLTFQKEHIERAREQLYRYGYWIILANRFLPALRSIISIAAGLIKLQWIYVSLAALVSCVGWNALLLYVGTQAGQNLEHIESWFQQYNSIILTLILLATIIGITYKTRKKAPKS